MKTIVIDRKKWGRGYLYNEDTEMACALGQARQQIYKIKNPYNVVLKDMKRDPCEIALCNNMIVRINDMHINRAEKEKRLKEAFKKSGLNLEFIN